MLSLLLAATFSFTATATGVEKGTALEFVFAGKNSDRDYESMFLLDQPIDDFCKGIEQAGVLRGQPTDPRRCRLWPTGCSLSFKPAILDFISGTVAEGESPDPIYTGGTRLPDGSCEASGEMPAALFSIYSLAQAPIVFNGIFEQGAVYGRLTAKVTLEKGRRYSFEITADEKSLPKHLDLTARPGNASELIKLLRKESARHELDVTVGFSSDLTLFEAKAVAEALSMIDSSRVKINGCTAIFYRAFLPLVQWLDRQERLQQPFELTLGGTVDSDELIFIAEDWSGPGDDPVLTPRKITFDEVSKHERTDTCFVFASPSNTISRLEQSIRPFKKTQVHNLYVFLK